MECKPCLLHESWTCWHPPSPNPLSTSSLSSSLHIESTTSCVGTGNKLCGADSSNMDVIPWDTGLGSVMKNYSLQSDTKATMQLSRCLILTPALWVFAVGLEIIHRLWLSLYYFNLYLSHFLAPHLWPLHLLYLLNSSFFLLKNVEYFSTLYDSMSWAPSLHKTE